jgi:hypothetical protein
MREGIHRDGNIFIRRFRTRISPRPAKPICRRSTPI